MLTKWAARRPASEKNTMPKRVQALLVAAISFRLHARLKRPRHGDTAASQKKSTDKPEKHLKLQNFVRTDDNDRIWTRLNEKELQLHIPIAAHFVVDGHQGCRTKYSAVSAHFWWNGTQNDVKFFVRTRTRCSSTVTGEKVPRPLGHWLDGSGPSDTSHRFLLHHASRKWLVLRAMTRARLQRLSLARSSCHCRYKHSCKLFFAVVLVVRYRAHEGIRSRNALQY